MIDSWDGFKAHLGKSSPVLSVAIFESGLIDMTKKPSQVFKEMKASTFVEHWIIWQDLVPVFEADWILKEKESEFIKLYRDKFQGMCLNIKS